MIVVVTEREILHINCVMLLAATQAEMSGLTVEMNFQAARFSTKLLLPL